MAMSIASDCIVSVTEIVKNFGSMRTRVKEGANLIVFKNNKPDLAIIDIEEYEYLMTLAEKIEQYNISKIIEERKAKEDDGVRYTLEDAKRMFAD